MNKQNRVTRLAQAGMIAAFYVALTLLVQPLSFGAIQLRLSEMLTILPVYTPAAIPGLTVGCFLSNLIGLSSGANPAGGWDLLLGTLATGLSAVLSYGFRHLRVKTLPALSATFPVILNALIVGAELYVVYGGMPLWLHITWVAVGQIGACFACGLLLAWTMEKTGITKYLK